MFGGPEWIWVILVVVLVFGASRLPMVGRNFGRGIKEFKQGISEGIKDDSQKPAAERPADPASDEQKPLN
jgi:sec-independent protein translocase protein TatA